MSLFLSDSERKAIMASRDEGLTDHRWHLNARCTRRTANPGLMVPGTTVEWWHCAHEYISDAAMCWALKNDAAIGGWLRGVTLDVARRSLDDWVGPWFRDHAKDQPCGHLETAHLSWAVSAALDLAPGVFTPAEQDELRTVLRERAMPLCLRWLDTHHHLANWRCILGAGYAVPAAVLGDEAALDRCEAHFALAQECLQDDGSSGESLQYGHYAMTGLMLSAEALIRRRPHLAATLPLERCSKATRWFAASLLYRKPLSGWGQGAVPRSANFNDSAAIFACSSDVALHLAVRLRERMPREAGVARWLADTCCPATPDHRVDDRASFGFVPRPGFLTLPLLAQAPAAQPPDLRGVEAFANGDVMVRSGRTVLAVHGGGEPLNGPGHLHGDLNSCILAHRDERMLVDPGHSCYRGQLHAVEVQSQSHNTLTFNADGTVIQQRTVGQRTSADGRPGPAIERGACRLIASELDGLQVIASECAAAYGAPLTRVVRCFIQCSPRVLYIVDQVQAERPLQTIWNWVLNNRDGSLDLKMLPPDRLVARRGVTGMKLFHCAGGRGPQLVHGWMHDAYHPLPGQLGEGGNGSAQIVRWSSDAATTLNAVHAIVVDGYGPVAGWHLRPDPSAVVLEAPAATERWGLTLGDGGISISESVSARRWRVACTGDDWTLTNGPNA
jgi:hypothetical protein